MFTNIFIKLFRLFMTIIISVVIIAEANTVLAQPPLISQIKPAKDIPVLTTANATNLPVPLDPAKISFQEIASDLTNPVFITNAGDGSGRIFIVEQTGFIRILKNGVLLGTPFLDIHSIIKSGGEQGLLALAFHPSYSTNGIFFVAYTAPKNGDATGSNLVLERFSVSINNPDLANPTSGVILLTISHPVNSNHNGGTLAFGEDGYLYWSTGDGGSSGDPPNNAQQLNNLLGKLLRINVNSGLLYGIPTSNPFYSNIDPNVKKEIWAYGLRNPWRFSFDRLTHDLYIGDVGQDVEEEVNFQIASSTGGQNYGWHILEGDLCYNPSVNCIAPSGYVPPISTYDHGANDSYGCSIIGGYVYRGSNFPSLYSHYFYGDYCSGRLFSLYNDPILGWNSVQSVGTPYTISTFGEDEQGELYLADVGAGKLYNIQYQEGPTVTSILRTDSNPTASANVNFTVVFSESVTGVDVNDFSLITSGILGASVTNVSGSGATYTVTVSTGNGNGTIRLDVVNDNTIKNAVLKPLRAGFTSGQMYDIDKIAPTVISSLRAGNNPTSATGVNFTVVFSEAVIGVDKTDFTLMTTDVTGATVGGVNGSGSVYTITVNTGAGDGTIRLDVPITATITDLASNPLTGLPYTSGDTYTINKPPTAATNLLPNVDIGTNYNPTYQWDKVATATYYHLYVTGPGGVVVDQWYDASLICNTTTCSVTPGPSAALGGGSYSWYVQTYNAIGYGPWSNNAQPTTFTTTALSVPAAATSLSPGTVNPATPADIGTNYTPTYSWDKITGATYYHLYVSGPSGVVLDQWYSSASICPMATCSVASPLLGGGTYSWYVQTYNSVGYGPWSNTSGSVIQPMRFATSSTPPTAATSLSPGTVNPATPADIGTNYTPTYSWDKITEATYYRLYVSGPSGVVLDQWYPSASICPTATCSVASPLLGGGTYSWYVQTYGPAGYGPWSNTNGSVIQPMRFNTSLTPPTAATSLSPGTVNPATPADIGTNYTPTYSWDKITGATWYRLYVSGPSGVALDQWYQAEVICPSTCSVTSPTLGGGTYSWYVQTYGPAGYGPWSNTVGSVIQPVRFTTSSTLPAAATSLSPGTVNPATPADIGTNYTPTYSWDKITGATWYRLYVSGPSGVVLDQWYQASSICPSTCSVTSPLLGGGTYSWYVQTYGPGGYGPWSNTVGSVIQPVRFSTTTTLSAATSLSPGTVNPATPTDIGTNYTPTYSWDKIASATWYHLYVSGPSGVVLDQWYQASSICPSTCSVTSPLLGGGTYSWYVQTYGPAGYGPWSNTTGSVIQPVRFTTATPAIPAGATLTLPTPGATTASHIPTYTWTKVDMATWYHLYVKGPGGVVVKDQWYQSSSVCIGATCTVVSPTLESGFHTWWIQTYNAAGYGPWKSATFTVSP
jgi:glucose/arabinose dehydrogenase